MSNVISIDVIADVKKAVKGIDDVNSKLGSIGKSVKSGGATLKGLFAFEAIKQGAQALGGFLKSAFDEAQESVKVGAQTAAVLKSTQGAAGLTAQAFGDLATSISNKTGIDDEQIQAGENMLATFTSVRNEVGKGNDIFTQATKVSTDLAVATGVDQVKANVMLGKALNDPIKGVGALSRVGVTFTQQQKDQIKAMQQAGDTAGAQKIILGELTKEFGGSAEAQATAADKAKVGWDNFKEGIGTALLPVLNQLLDYFNVKIVPALQVFATWLQVHIPPAIEVLKAKFAEVKAALEPVMAALGAVIGFLKRNPETVKAFAITLGILAGALGIASAAMAVLNFVMALNPISIIIVAIALLVAGIVYAYTHFKTFKTVVQTTWTVIKTVTSVAWAVIKAVIVTAVKLAVGIVKVQVAIIKTVITGTWAVLKAVTKAVWTAIKFLIINPIKLAASGVKSAINGIKSAAVAVWNGLKSVTNAAWRAIKNYVVNPIKGLPAQIKGYFERIRAGISEKVSAIKEKIKAIKTSITNAFSNAGQFLYNAGKRIIDGLLSGLRAAASKVTDFLHSLTDKIPDWKGPADKDAKLLTDAGRLIMQSLVDGFDDGESGVKKQLMGTTKLIASAFSDVSSPVITPTVSLNSARFDPGSLAGNGGGNTYQITVNAPVGSSSAEIGKSLVSHIDAFNNAGGRRSR